MHLKKRHIRYIVLEFLLLFVLIGCSVPEQPVESIDLDGSPSIANASPEQTSDIIAEKNTPVVPSVDTPQEPNTPSEDVNLEQRDTPEKSNGVIYLYGERHGVKAILEKEFEIWQHN